MTDGVEIWINQWLDNYCPVCSAIIKHFCFLRHPVLLKISKIIIRGGFSSYCKYTYLSPLVMFLMALLDKIIEALLFGDPVIVNRAGGLSSFARPGVIAQLMG